MQLLHYSNDSMSMTLAEDIDASVTTFTVAGYASAPSVPYWMKLGRELIEVLGQTGATINECVRDPDNAAPHFSGDPIKRVATWEYMEEDHTELRMLRAFVGAIYGGEGIVRGDGSRLLVTATGTPGMTVQVATGMAVIGGYPTWIETSHTTAAMTAPVTNPRIDIVQIDAYNTISVKAGTEAATPAAPAADAGNLILAEIYHRVGETSIKDVDDASNGYITDKRATTGYV